MPKLQTKLPTADRYFTRTPNLLLDHLLPGLKDTELRLLLVLIRDTTGWNRDRAAVSLTYRMLAKRTGRHAGAIAHAIRSLEKRGLIHRLPLSGIRKAKQATAQSERPTRDKKV